MNPFEKNGESALNPYVEGLLAAIPSEIMGVKPAEAILLGAKSGPSAIAMLLGKMAIRAIMKRVKKKPVKHRKKKVEENTIDETE